MGKLDKLAKMVESGDNVAAVAEADKLLEEGVPVKEIIEDGLTTALQALRHKCTVENFQLLEVLLSSRAMVEVVDQVIAKKLEAGMDTIADNHESENGGGRGKTLVIGTIAGDVHDLGKHLVATMSRLSGINVINLGKDVPPENFIEAAIKEKAHFIGVSSLMTVCLPTINEIRSIADSKGIAPIIVAGGAAAQQAEADDIDVDYIAFDAFDGLDYLLKTPVGGGGDYDLHGAG